MDGIGLSDKVAQLVIIMITKIKKKKIYIVKIIYLVNINYFVFITIIKKKKKKKKMYICKNINCFVIIKV